MGVDVHLNWPVRIACSVYLAGWIACVAAPGVALGQFAVLAACHVPVGLGAWRLAHHLFGSRSRECWTGVRIALAFQVYFALLIAAGLLLGVMGLLTTPGMLAASGVIGLPLCYIGAPTCRSFSMRSPSDEHPSPFGTILISIVVVLAAWHAVTEPDYMYDTLTYHLVFPARWAQDKYICIVPMWFGDPAPSYAPLNCEVYYSWLMVPFGGDFLARCGQFPFWLLLLSGASGLAAALRLSHGMTRGLVLLVALIPGIAAQSATAMVDVAMAAHMVCVAMFALRYGRTRAVGDAIGLILSAGLMLGTKFVAAPMLLAMAPLVIWSVVRGRRGLRGRHPAGLAVSVLLAAWVGLFWYGRNWIETGNPVYPLTVRIGERTVFDGAYGREQMQNSAFFVRRGSSLSGLDRTLWEGLQSPTMLETGDTDGRLKRFVGVELAVGGLILLALFLVGEGRAGWPRTVGLLALTIILALVVFWYVVPFQQPRFAWGILVMALILLGRVSRLHRWAGPAVFVGLACVWVVWFGGQWGEVFVPQRAPDARAKAFASPRWRFIGEFWRWSDENLHNATIAYSGNNLPYFLFGRKLENRVVHVAARLPAEAPFHVYATSPEALRLGPPNTSEPACSRYVMDPAIWMENLRKMGVEYVVVNSMQMFTSLVVANRHDEVGFPIEREWLDALCSPVGGGPPLAERMAFGQGGVLLYRLNLRNGAAPTGLRSVDCDETDALDRLQQERTPPGAPIRDYPCARRYIEQHGMRTLFQQHIRSVE